VIDVELFLLNSYLERLNEWVHDRVSFSIIIGGPSVFLKTVDLVVIVVLSRCRRDVLLLTQGLIFGFFHFGLYFVLQELSILLEHL
jgi:hypothetical protein